MFILNILLGIIFLQTREGVSPVKNDEIFFKVEHFMFRDV